MATSPDDLSVLAPEPVLVGLASGEVVVVRPCPIRDLHRLVSAVAPIREDLASGIGVADIMLAAPDALIDAVAVVTGMDRPEVRDLSGSDFYALLQSMIEQDATFFGRLMAPAEAAGSDAQSPEWGWADNLQLLISAGHRLDDILDYTLDQVEWWAAAIHRQALTAQIRGAASAQMAWRDSAGILGAMR